LPIDWGKGKVKAFTEGLVVRDETGCCVKQVFGQAGEREKGVAGAIGEVFGGSGATGVREW
jgi:hypothetical protein